MRSAHTLFCTGRDTLAKDMAATCHQWSQRLYSVFTLRKSWSPLILYGERGFLWMNGRMSCICRAMFQILVLLWSRVWKPGRCCPLWRHQQISATVRETWRVRGHQLLRHGACRRWCWENCFWSVSYFIHILVLKARFWSTKSGALSRVDIFVGVRVHWAAILFLMPAKIDGPSKFKDID